MPTYAGDGSTPGGYHALPSARSLSNLFSVDTCNDCTAASPLHGCNPDPSGASAMVWQFGQLLDHEVLIGIQPVGRSVEPQDEFHAVTYRAVSKVYSGLR